eukprot:CAMPEP_0119272818 /NCGR_PEP_ID=MMETSP1329-20130426/9097_1 /TAXON_ID=114041 /ORGANISM="Genus nov. species nov., Strain RCC1024" /LENGTH=165 /DNA_ID=CAMNT_0007272927 /DNA_START=59 /DNA_END=556 /DNA_ORIENTATION=+
MARLLLAALVLAPACAFAPHKGLQSRSLMTRSALASPSSMLDVATSLPTMTVADLPTLVVPPEGALHFLFASPFFIAFFILSITAGLPFLAWLRLSSLADVDDEAPYDLSGVVPSPPSLPSLPKIPRIRDIEVPDAVAEKAGVRKGAKASALIDMLPWNEPGQLK